MMKKGIEPHKNIQMVIDHAGGYGRCTFTKRDARNHIDKHRREKLSNIKGGDAQTLMDYFQKKKLRDPNFFYAYSYTPEGRLQNIIWSDGRGRAAYKYFHDIIVLDSTYLKNKYNMPLVLFVGVNHHGQTIIFACALVSNEYEENYNLVFSRFIDCMIGIHPGAFLTDQCLSIENGIKNVLKGTVHRYCAWHIIHKLLMKWGRKPNKKGLSEQVKSVVYSSNTIPEFADRWGALMKKLGYHSDPWFKELFEIRNKWVPVFLNYRFCSKLVGEVDK